jgi:hypothetical protein
MDPIKQKFTQKTTLSKESLKRTQDVSEQAAIQVPLKRCQQLMWRGYNGEYDECASSQIPMGHRSLMEKDFALSPSSPLPAVPAFCYPARPHSPTQRTEKHHLFVDSDRRVQQRIPKRIKRRRFERRNSKVGKMFYEKDSCTLAYLASVSENNEIDLYEEVVKKMQSSVHLT